MSFGIPKESAKQIAIFLVGYGLITEDQLSHANNHSSEGGKGLIDTIIEFGFVKEEDITKAISETYELNTVDLSDESVVDVSAVSSLPKKFITENRVIPIRCTDDELDIVISEPSVLNLVSSIRLLTDKKINTHISTFSQIDQFLAGLDDMPIEPAKSEKKQHC